jgi:hypothetical protein
MSTVIHPAFAVDYARARAAEAAREARLIRRANLLRAPADPRPARPRRWTPPWRLRPATLQPRPGG